jgi:hypothetical protein
LGANLQGSEGGWLNKRGHCRLSDHLDSRLCLCLHKCFYLRLQKNIDLGFRRRFGHRVQKIFGNFHLLYNDVGCGDHMDGR